MSLDDLPADIQYRVGYFDEEGGRWLQVAEDMSGTYSGLMNGERIPPFSERIPQNLRSFGDAANRAFDAYVEVLDKGAKCAESVGETLRESGLEYLRQEGYGEEQVAQIKKELDDD